MYFIEGLCLRRLADAFPNVVGDWWQLTTIRSAATFGGFGLLSEYGDADNAGAGGFEGGDFMAPAGVAGFGAGDKTVVSCAGAKIDNDVSFFDLGELGGKTAAEAEKADR